MSKLNMNRQRNRKKVIATKTNQTKQRADTNIKKQQETFVSRMPKK